MWKLSQFRNPPGELPAYGNETVCSLCSRSFPRPEDLSQHLFEHLASSRLSPILSDKSEDGPSQNSRSVRQRRPNVLDNRKQAKRGMLSGAPDAPPIIPYENSLSNQEIRSGRGRGSPPTSNCLDDKQIRQNCSANLRSGKDLETFPEHFERSRRLSYLQGKMEPAMHFLPGEAPAQTYDRSFHHSPTKPPTGPLTTQERIRPSHVVQSGATGDVQLIRKRRTRQAENASLQKQLGQVGRKLRCLLCNKGYSRIDRLHDHIRYRQDERHQCIAAKMKETRCVDCKKQFRRQTELVKHEQNFHGKVYGSRVEMLCKLFYPARVLDMEATNEHRDPLVITRDENYQPDTSIPLTNEAQILNTLERENAASSANLKPASSISGFNMNIADGCLTEQEELNSFCTETGGHRGLIDTFSTNSVDHDSLFTQTGGYRGLIDTFSTNSVDHDSLFTQTRGYRGLIDTFSTNSVDHNSLFTQTGGRQGLIDTSIHTGGHQGLIDTFSTNSVDHNSLFTQTEGRQGLIDPSIHTGGHQGLIDTFSTNSVDLNSSFIQLRALKDTSNYVRGRNSSINERRGYHGFPNEVGGHRTDMNGFPTTSGFVWNHGGN
jgi:hypothetical protein